MNKTTLFTVFCVLAFNLNAQAVLKDTVTYGKVTIQKDRRIDMLGEKMLAYNIALTKNVRTGKGYRLMLLTTNDRNLAMQLRSKLLQQFPEHKVYMIYQNPFIKLKMGNFTEREEAERVRKQLLRIKMTPGNIYLVPENIEIKPAKEEDQD